MAGPRNREESLLITNLTTAAASCAAFSLASGGRSRAFASVATLETWNAQLGRHAIGRFFERDLEVVAKIGATLRCRAARAATPAKHITETKQVAENVFESAKSRRTPGSLARGAARNTGMTEAVVTFALLAVGQHAVSLRSFLELLLGTGVVGILVRVILDCEPPVGALNLLIRSGAANGKYFVIIAFVHTVFLIDCLLILKNPLNPVQLFYRSYKIFQA